MSASPSLIYEVCIRFDGLKAIGVSRHAAKRRLRAEAQAQGLPLSPIGLSTGRIHADKTLETYKGIALRYAHWARTTYGARCLEDLDGQAHLLVTSYLRTRMAAGDSASTLKTVRSALRLFHWPGFPIDGREEFVRALGAGVALPERRREAIVRSRRAVAMDQEIVAERYREIIDVCRATGLRRRELQALTVGAVMETGGRLTVLVRNGKGGKERRVPVVPGMEVFVRRVIRWRHPDERVFPRVPVRLDIHSYRREYAQALYCEGDTRPLPDPVGRLVPGSVDQARALYVSRALGHNRIDVVLRHYLR